MLKPSEIGVLRGFREPAGEPDNWIEAAPHFTFSGTFDYDLGAQTIVNLKTGTARQHDQRLYNVFSTEDNADISFHVESVRVDFLDLAAIQLNDPEKWQTVFEGIYLEISDGTVTEYVNCGPACGFTNAPAGVAYVDSDNSAGLATYAYSAVAREMDLATPIRFSLRSTKTIALKATAATASQLTADSAVRLRLGGYAWQGSAYDDEPMGIRRKCGITGRNPIDEQKGLGIFKLGRRLSK